MPYEDCSEGETRRAGYQANFSTRPSPGDGLAEDRSRRKKGRAQTKWRRNGARAQPAPNSTEDPKTATAKPDQLLAAAEIPSGPPRSPMLRNTDA
jgi:hypothetical protein